MCNIPFITGQIVMTDTVSAGHTRQYMVDPIPGSTFIWWIDGIVQTPFTTNELECIWSSAGTHLIQVRELSSYGCPGPVRSGLVYVRVEADPAAVLNISKAFSPNNDGINDTWIIGNVSMYPSMEITIYNRWGQPVWKSGRGYPVPWDGRRNGADLPVDSYHYIIDLHNGTRLVIGDITIVR